ncbi:MAG: asparagine synthase C-terminal domain-containing protein [Candidatus Altiarchaeota archaeon]|nr:asparagine synthase C-terminal domain-containing protein [Candidatus Altiarchaeota archaeon]
MTQVSGELIEALDTAVKRNIREENVGVVLSGGLDSTLIAALATRHSQVTGYTVGTGNSEDVSYVRKLSKKLDIKLEIIDLTLDDLREKLPHIVSLAGTNPVKVGASIPLYYVTLRVSEKTTLSGQGADELFGGYHKYLEVITEKGYPGLQEEMAGDVKAMYEENLRREERICEQRGLDIRYPFMDSQFIKYSLSLPPREKIKIVNSGSEFSCIDEVGEKRYVRKYLLRKAAQHAGLPREVLDRKKKAAQYGSGAHKLLIKLAKEQGSRKTGKKNYLSMFLKGL